MDRRKGNAKDDGSLVFVSGMFSSGSTLAFTLFRKTGQFHCLYEPLHEDLEEFLIWPLKTYVNHHHVESYFDEYKGFSRIPELFSDRWGRRDFYMDGETEAPDLERYLRYLVYEAGRRSPRVMLKTNRMLFRLPWLKRCFPHARIIHIYRDCDRQWGSWLRRSPSGLSGVGHADSPAYNGFGMGNWCDDLSGQFPELEESESRTGYERFSKLWKLSHDIHVRYADTSVKLETLLADFESSAFMLFEGSGAKVDYEVLARFVVRDQVVPATNFSRFRGQLADGIHRIGRRYAAARVRARHRKRDRHDSR